MGERFQRGLRLARASVDVVRDQPGLLVVPVIAGVAALLLLALGGALFGATAAAGGGAHGLAILMDAALLVAVLFVGIVAHATIVVCAGAYFDGRHLSPRDGMRAALEHGPALLGWAVISAVVGTILRAVEERGGIIGAIGGRLLDVAWSAVTFFVIPVVVFEGIGPVDAVKRSAHIFRARWGEQFVGNGVFGIVGLVGFLALFLVGFLLAAITPVLIVLLVPFALALIVVLSACTAVFNTVLYRYAVDATVAAGFDVADVQGAFRPRRRRSPMGF